MVYVPFLFLPEKAYINMCNIKPLPCQYKIPFYLHSLPQTHNLYKYIKYLTQSTLVPKN